jgi:hypothetical protein
MPVKCDEAKCTAIRNRNGNNASIVTRETVNNYIAGKKEGLAAATKLVAQQSGGIFTAKTWNVEESHDPYGANAAIQRAKDPLDMIKMVQTVMKANGYRYVLVGGGYSNLARMPTDVSSVCSGFELATFLLGYEPGCFLICQVTQHRLLSGQCSFCALCCWISPHNAVGRAGTQTLRRLLAHHWPLQSGRTVPLVVPSSRDSFPVALTFAGSTAQQIHSFRGQTARVLAHRSHQILRHHQGPHCRRCLCQITRAVTTTKLKACATSQSLEQGIVPQRAQGAITQGRCQWNSATCSARGTSILVCRQDTHVFAVQSLVRLGSLLVATRPATSAVRVHRMRPAVDQTLTPSGECNIRNNILRIEHHTTVFHDQL